MIKIVTKNTFTPKVVRLSWKY